MNTDTILNILVAAITIHSVSAARFNLADRAAKMEQYGAKYGVTAGLSTLTMLGLWVWLAIETEVWQFAAIVAIPLLVTIGSTAAATSGAAKRVSS